MKIESVDLFYLSIPHVRDIANGSQDALLSRVQGGGLTGWGDCAASPLVCIANWCCPMSTFGAKPVRQSVIGQTLDSPDDVVRIGNLVRAHGVGIAQTDHTLSGVEVAMWDLLGKKRGQPVYEMLSYRKAHPKIPYASQLFGDTAEETHNKAIDFRKRGFRAVKFGWGPFGRASAQEDRDQVMAARQGLGPDGILLVDAGTVWVDNLQAAKERLPALFECKAHWLEEPFVSGAVEAYAGLAKVSGALGLAGGEGAHNFLMAKQMIDHAGIRFIQIDTGRIGGIAPAKHVADYARAKGVTFVNHSFTTHLNLSACLQPYAGIEEAELCEYPVEPSALATELYHQELAPEVDGLVRIPDAPGLGVEPEPRMIQKYLVEAQIEVGGRVLYDTPKI